MSQSGEKFKQTRAKGGSINDSLKVTSSECQSNGNLKQAWVNGGRGLDALKIPIALNFPSDGCSCSVALWLRDDLEEVLGPALPLPRVRLSAGDEQRALPRNAEVRHSGDRSHRLRVVAGAARPGRAL